MPWISGAELAEYLGQSDQYASDAEVTARFDDRAAVASTWAFVRRSKYGYADTADLAPDATVKEGTLMFGAILLRDQGAYDGALSFSEFSGVNVPTGGSWGQVQRLLRVPRAVVA